MTEEQRIRSIMRRKICPNCFKKNFKPKETNCIYIHNGDEDICEKADLVKRGLKTDIGK